MRLLYIITIFIQYRLDEIILTPRWFYPFELIRLLNPLQYFRLKKISRGERFRLALEKLGPIFVKFGQVLSTRRDFFPEDISSQLEKLQDQVPSFSSEQAKKIIEESIGNKIEELFLLFEEIPLASASIAQVHGAVLKSGERVVVKVLRPQVEKKIRCDIAVLKRLGRWAGKILSHIGRAQPLALVEEFERIVLSELNLYLEAGNASQLRKNFKNSDRVYIPEIYWNFCRKNVLVLERIDGDSIFRFNQLNKDKVNATYLAKAVIEMFFTQVFYHNFFHGDLHPGNIFVNCKDLEKPYFILVDFGAVGSLSSSDQQYIAENLVAFFNRDYYRVAQLHVESGWLSSETKVHEFASAIRAMSEPIFEKPLKEISIGILLLRLFQTARQFHINIQPQLLLLQKNLLYVEGMARQLDVELDLWATAKPFLENWLKEKKGLRAFLRNLCEKLPELPGLIVNVLRKMGS